MNTQLRRVLGENAALKKQSNLGWASLGLERTFQNNGRVWFPVRRQVNGRMLTQQEMNRKQALCFILNNIKVQNVDGFGSPFRAVTLFQLKNCSSSPKDWTFQSSIICSHLGRKGQNYIFFATGERLQVTPLFSWECLSNNL